MDSVIGKTSAPHIPGLHRTPAFDEPRVFFAEWFLDEISRGKWPFWSIDHDSRLVKLTSETKVRVWRLTGRIDNRNNALTGRDIGHEAVWPD